MNASKIVHVLPCLGVGGAEGLTIDLLAALRNRCQPHLISMFDRMDTPLERRADEAGITVHYLGKKFGKDSRMFGRIAAVLDALQPEVIHTHLYGLPYCMRSLWRRRTRWFHTIHNVAARDARGVTRFVNRLAFQLGVHPVAISEQLRGDVALTYGLTRVDVVPNGIAVSRFRLSESARTRVRTELGFDDKDVVLTAIGRLVPVKNHASLLRAFVLASKCNPSTRLLIVGDGILRNQLRQLSKDLGVDRAVRFLGERAGVPAILSASDVFVISSLAEGNPLSVMEAMAAGLPVIASNVGGIPDLVDGMENGILVSPECIPDISEGIQRLAGNIEFRQTIGAANARKALARFDISLTADKYWELYCAAT